MGRHPLRPGDPASIGEYTLSERLGSGGMGTVFLGHTPQNMPVAIKVIRTDLTDHPEFLGRFRSEVSRVRQVPPYCTAAVIDADLDHDPPYLVVEYVDGPNLSDVVRDHGPLSPHALHAAALGIAGALTGIHGAGVIHRDLKPANVLFAPGGVKVIDFGIARPLEATSQHTRTDQMVGTVSYMAPERFDDGGGPHLDAAADIFAWGAVVTFAGTGRTPFEGESAPATMMRILTKPPTLTGLPDSLRLIVARSLAKDPVERPTARELVDLLLAADPLNGPTSSALTLPASTSTAPVADPPTRARRARIRAYAAMAAAVAVLAGLLGYTVLSGGDSAPPARTQLASSDGPAPAAAAPPPGTEGPSTGPSKSVPPSTSTSRAASPSAPQASANTAGRNLALNTQATASTVEGQAWRASNAVDGNLTTRWSSGFSDPQWLRVDLGGTWQISEVTLHWENAHATEYKVELSTDGTTWKSVFSTGSGQGSDVVVEVAKVPARYVRMYGTKRNTNYGYSLLEITVR
ncbi:protein kinase domain-containing protein [Virgisporangium aliadipatigenens]|uniref:protein kinase domain-containing protein n=1 Tax=Virgisporangium aliadipatigenens TaxID=741659 RepID=UPI001EF258A8|nr:protein kinase [Virgisporangium aliadipatigenens]